MQGQPSERRAGLTLLAVVVAVVVAFAALPASVQAQTYGQLLDSEIPLSTQTGRNQGVNDRYKPELRQQGIPVGGFDAYAEAAGGIGYTSNVIGVENGATGDFYAAFEPRLRLRSQWSRHSLTATAAYEGKRYFDTSQKDEDGYLFSVNGNLDLLERGSLLGVASIRRTYEDKTAGSFPINGGGSIAVDKKRVLLRGTHAFNQLRLTVSTDYNDFNYHSTVTTTGQQLDLDYRDHSVSRASARFEYSLSPDNAVFGQATYRRTEYERRNTRSDRTSDEWRASVGAIADVTSFLRVAGAVGYFHRTYSNPAFKTVGDIDVDLQWDYYLTPLTTVSGVVTRQLEEASVTGSSGFISTRVGMRVDHELLRNLVLYALWDRVSDKFKGIDRDDERWNFGVGTLYQPNRDFTVDVSVGYVTRDSVGTGRGPNVDELRSLITLKFHP